MTFVGIETAEDRGGGQENRAEAFFGRMRSCGTTYVFHEDFLLSQVRPVWSPAGNGQPDGVVSCCRSQRSLPEAADVDRNLA
jgi:hypothetical protein